VSPCSAAIGAPGGGERSQQHGAERGQRGYSEYSQGTPSTHRGYSEYSQGVLRYRVEASGRSSAVRSASSAEIPNDTAVHAEYLPHKPTHRIHTHRLAHASTHTLPRTWVGRAGRGRARTHVATIGSFVLQRYAWTTWNLLMDNPDIDVARREMRSRYRHYTPRRVALNPAKARWRETHVCPGTTQPRLPIAVIARGRSQASVFIGAGIYRRIIKL
jgi:hypothetical protein